MDCMYPDVLFSTNESILTDNNSWQLSFGEACSAMT
jgi:hypothetical protein